MTVSQQQMEPEKEAEKPHSCVPTPIEHVWQPFVHCTQRVALQHICRQMFSSGDAHQAVLEEQARASIKGAPPRHT